MKPRDLPNLKRLLRSLKEDHKDSIKAGALGLGYNEKSYSDMVARKFIGSLERAIKELERRKH